MKRVRIELPPSLPAPTDRTHLARRAGNPARAAIHGARARIDATPAAVEKARRASSRPAGLAGVGGRTQRGKPGRRLPAETASTLRAHGAVRAACAAIVIILRGDDAESAAVQFVRAAIAGRPAGLQHRVVWLGRGVRTMDDRGRGRLYGRVVTAVEKAYRREREQRERERRERERESTVESSAHPRDMRANL